MSIKIAAIIPLFNGRSFIGEALESVLAQTEPADEIIVVDDGSTDDGPEIVKRMASNHPIQLFMKTNGGQSSARNFGVAASSASHIALLDQDDIWTKDHLAALKKPFMDQAIVDLGYAHGNVDQIDERGRVIIKQYLDNSQNRHPKMSLKQCLEGDMTIVPGATLIAKTAFNKIGGFDERLVGYEDDDLFLRMFVEGFNSAYLKDKSVLKWRIHSSSTTYSSRMATSRMIYFRKLKENFPDDSNLGLYWVRDIVAPRFIRVAYWEFIKNSRSRDELRVRQAWKDFQEILPCLNGGVRRRVQLFVPIISWFERNRFLSIARVVIRVAARPLKRRRTQRD